MASFISTPPLAWCPTVCEAKGGKVSFFSSRVGECLRASTHKTPSGVTHTGLMSTSDSLFPL